MEEKYLPLGSVCLLKGGQRYIVVIGYLGVGNEDMNTIYDYMGAVYPLGVISTDVTFMFNHDQIEKVVFKGYEDDERKEFNQKLNELNKDEVLAKMQESAAQQPTDPVSGATPMGQMPTPGAGPTAGTPGAM